jgi:hypothetical protein
MIFKLMVNCSSVIIITKITDTFRAGKLSICYTHFCKKKKNVSVIKNTKKH